MTSEIDPIFLTCDTPDCNELLTHTYILPCLHTFCGRCENYDFEEDENKSEDDDDEKDKDQSEDDDDEEDESKRGDDDDDENDRPSRIVLCRQCCEQFPLLCIKKNTFIADLVKRINKKDLRLWADGFKDTKKYIKLSEVDHIYCAIHTSNIIDKYCVQCDIATCGTCLLHNHRHHKLVDLEEQAAISKHQLQGLLQKTDVIIKRIDNKIQYTEINEKRSTNDINSLRLQRNLNDDLFDIEYNKEQQIKFVREGQERIKHTVISLRTYIENILHHGRDIDLVLQMTDIQSRLDTLNKTRIHTFVWSRYDEGDDEESPWNNKKVANVSYTLQGDGDDDYKWALPLGIEDVIVKEIPLSMKCMMCIELLGDTLMVVGGRKSKIKAYDTSEDFHIPETLHIKGMSDPIDMVRFPPGQSQLVISDYDKQLLWIKLEQRDGVWKVTSERAVEVSYRPLGLGVRDNQLLVCDNNMIHVLSTSGEETHRVNMLPRGVRPWKAVAQLTSPGFVIMDNINALVVLVSVKGIIQRTYKGDYWHNIHDIVCFGRSIYVASRQCTLDMLGDEACFIRNLTYNVSSSIGLSRKLCVDDKGRLYLACFDDYCQNSVRVIEPVAIPTDILHTLEYSIKLIVTWE